MTFQEALDSYVAGVQTLLDSYKERHGFKVRTTLEVGIGKKFAKVFRVENGRRSSIHSFVDMVTGNVFKPASYNAPAKHARGNVYRENAAAEACDRDGFVRYIK
jgi:hypothetical protein